MDKKLLFNALADVLAASDRRVPQESVGRILAEIQKDYDSELMDKMDKFFMQEAADRNGVLSMGKVLATVSFFISHTIYDACDTDDQICIMAQSYADYIHQTAHGLFHEHGVSPNKKKLG